MKKRILALSMSIVMVLALAACGGSGTTSTSDSSTPGSSEAAPSAGTESSEVGGSQAAEPAATGEKVVNVAMTTSMGDVGPFVFSSPGRNNMRYLTYEYLAVFETFGTSWQDMDWVLAKNITQIDETTYQVEIYDYIVDAIGNPITAKDVEFCMTTLQTNGNLTRLTSYLESCTVVDDYTVEIKLQSSLVGVIEYVMCQVNIVSEETYKANESKMATTPITTGPYQITECVSGSYYVLEKNENYWQTDERLRGCYARQDVDKMVYNIITEASQATIAMQMGEVDIITSVRTSELAYFDNNPDYTVNKILDTTPIVMGFNMQEGSMFKTNVALRQAMCYAIDPDAVIAGAMDGHGEKLYDVGLNGCSDFNAKWVNEDYYNFSVDKAKELMAEAGYADGIDPATKAPLKIRFLCDTARKDAGVVMQAQLAAIGIEAELLAMDDAMYKEYNYDPTRWDVFLTKQGTEAYITNVYDGFLLQTKDGVAAKTFDVDPVLEELLQVAHNVNTHNEESIDALHYYVKDNALLYGVYVGYSFTVGRAGIELKNHPWGPVVPSGSDFTGFFA